MSTAVRAATSDALTNARWVELTRTLISSVDLTTAQTAWAIRETVEGRADDVRLAGFLTALQAKGPTAAELLGVVRALVDSAVAVRTGVACADIVGTGGDGTQTINLSTPAAIIAAGAGASMIKHGGRAASSRSAGSADLVEALGIALDDSPATAVRRVQRDGFGYLFAPHFNPGLRHAIDVRRGLGIPTVFNVAAPLINPAEPASQVIGVARPEWGRLVAEVLQSLHRKGLVARGQDGLDKFSTVAPTEVWIVGASSIEHVVVDATDFGLRRASPSELRGADAAHNAAVVRAVLAGERGAVRDAAVLNAAAVLFAAESGPEFRAIELHDRLKDAIRRAEASIDDGAAQRVLARATR